MFPVDLASWISRPLKKLSKLFPRTTRKRSEETSSSKLLRRKIREGGAVEVADVDSQVEAVAQAGVVAVGFSHTEEASDMVVVTEADLVGMVPKHMEVTAGTGTVDTLNRTLRGGELADTEPTGPSDQVWCERFFQFSSVGAISLCGNSTGITLLEI